MMLNSLYNFEVSNLHLSLSLNPDGRMNCFFQFEILFCVQDELDPAVKIVRQLMEAYPLVNSRLFTGGSLVIILLQKT